MLVPPPRPLAGAEVSMATQPLEHDLDFRMPEGVWEAFDTQYVPTPMPHPTDPIVGPTNPLSGDTDNPGSSTSGVRLTPVPMHASPGVNPHGRAKKPKNSLVRNKSSFLSRAMFYDRFTYLFSDKDREKAAKSGGAGTAALQPPSGPEAGPVALWVSVGRGITLLDADLASEQRAEPLSRVLYTRAWPLVHAFNAHTRAPGNLDLVMGMSTGDVMWLEVVSAKYNRINKVGNLTHAAVTTIAWVPGSESLVAAGHADGTLVIYDVEREDGPAISPTGGGGGETLRVFVSSKRQASARHNPVAAYKVANQPLTDLAFEGSTLAVTSRDGYLRFLDLESEQVQDIVPSLFGGLYTVAFSPDGRYVATAGEDDTIGVYSALDRRLLARLSGHNAWVRRVVWDVFAASTDDAAGTATYRLGSAAEDGALILWDFAPLALPRLRSAAGARDAPAGPTHLGKSVLHPVVPRDTVPTVFPAARVVAEIPKHDVLPLTDLYFTPQGVTVAMSDGRLLFWRRPRGAALATNGTHAVGSHGRQGSHSTHVNHGQQADPGAHGVHPAGGANSAQHNHNPFVHS